LLQPTHTPFLISFPQVLHGVHPQVWHISTSFIPGSCKRKAQPFPLWQYGNPAHQPSLSGSVRNTSRSSSDSRTGVCPMVHQEGI